jgi:hypothetical protein
MLIYYFAYFMNNGFAPCENISFDDSSTQAEESIEWGGCMISEVQLSDIFEVPTCFPWIASIRVG